MFYHRFIWRDWGSILRAMQAVLNLSIDKCISYTDSQLQVSAVFNSQSPVCVQWQVYSEITQIWTIPSQQSGFTCRYMQREYNLEAHHIANWARIHQQQYTGFTFPLFA